MNNRTNQIPFAMPLEKELFHNITISYDKLVTEISNLFKEYGVTLTQYDVLESIKNAGKKGLPLLKIGERMLSRQPDVTRIVDRLEDVGWVTRVRDTKDRRVVYVRLSRRGLGLCEKIEGSLIKAHRDQFSHFSKNEMMLLNQLLIKIREKSIPLLKRLP